MEGARRQRAQELELEKRKQELYDLIVQANAAYPVHRKYCGGNYSIRTRLLAGRFIEHMASQFEPSSCTHADADYNFL
jgi:hypothetical protein